MVQRIGRRIDYQADTVVFNDISSYRTANDVGDGRNVAVFYYPYPGTKTIRASGYGNHSEVNIDQALTPPQKNQVNRIHSEFRPCNDGPGGGCETMIQQNYPHLNDNQITYWWEYGEEYEKVMGRAHKKDEHSWGKEYHSSQRLKEMSKLRRIGLANDSDVGQAKTSASVHSGVGKTVKLEEMSETSGDHIGASEVKLENKTGLPDKLKAGIENLSGLSMDDVKVHYNSSKPAQLQALAYTQGTDIHVGRGQERYLPHEAWHVVQQKHGRVQPTMQMKGTAINDDSALEKEADVMGAKALQIQNVKGADLNVNSSSQERENQENGAGGGSFEMPSARYPVAQMTHVIEATEDDFKILDQINITQGQLFFWQNNVNEIYSYIAQVMKVLEDDDDLEVLKNQEQKIDEIVQTLDKLTKSLKLYPSYSSTRGRRSQPREETQVTILEKIKSKSIELGKKFTAFKATFPLHEGGFSAKARAHDISVNESPQDGYKEDKTWFENIKLDNKDLHQTHKVYKSQARVEEKASNPVIPSDLVNLQETDQLDEIEKRLKKLDTSQNINLLGAPISKDRNGGQTTNMANTNATGYAKLASVPDWDKSRWEWLHIRAASLNGATDGSNLVVGTRDVNTHMMPFEANIRALANIVNTNDNYKSLNVEFSVTNPDKKAEHKVEQISIKWKLVKKDNVDVKETEGEANFKPLNTNASISKTEVEILEKTLKEKRKEVNGDSDMDIDESSDMDIDES